MSELTVKRLRELLHYDPLTGVFTRDGKQAGTTDRAYVAISIDNKLYGAHRLAWLYVHGVWPSEHVDHIDGNARNNRLLNLRDVSRSVNMQNRRKAQANNRSKLMGAMRNRDGWMARIQTNGVKRYLGQFPTAELAHQAYLNAKRELHEGCTI